MIIPAIATGLASGLVNAAGRSRGGTSAADIANVLESRRAMDRDDTAIQRRVADARAAGIHPLAALGASVSSSSWQPMFQGSSGGGNPIVEALAQSGQDITRALAAGMTPEAKQHAIMGQLQLENQSLQNDLLRSQLARLNQSPSVGLPSNSDMPGLTGSGFGGSYVVERPAMVTHAMPGNPAQEVGATTDYGFVRTPTGLAIVPSKDVKEKIEDQFIPETMWALRNQLLPLFGSGPARRPPNPKHFPLPPGASRWAWDWTAMEFRPEYSKSYNIKAGQARQRFGQRKATPRWHKLPSWHPDYSRQK